MTNQNITPLLHNITQQSSAVIVNIVFLPENTMAYIQEYEPQFHSEVNRIFGEGIIEHWPFAIRTGLRNPKLWSILAITFLSGIVCYSWTFAILLVTSFIGIYCFAVYYCYRQYVRYVQFCPKLMGP